MLSKVFDDLLEFICYSVPNSTGTRSILVKYFVILRIKGTVFQYVDLTLKYNNENVQSNWIAWGRKVMPGRVYLALSLVNVILESDNTFPTAFKTACVHFAIT